jgi:hypothetical protein
MATLFLTAGSQAARLVLITGKAPAGFCCLLLRSSYGRDVILETIPSRLLNGSKVGGKRTTGKEQKHPIAKTGISTCFYF